MSTNAASRHADEVVDLTDPVFLAALMRERHERRFDQDHIVEWLRSSGGPLADRIMKNLAADALERCHADHEHG